MPIWKEPGLQAYGLSAPDAALLARRIDVAHQFVRAWSIGRGQPITRVILEDVGVPPTFIDRAWEAAQAVGCLAQPTLAAIKALPRFRVETAAAIETRMRDLGLIDDI